ncbi:MAG: hypothetical protein EBR82_38815 [Caulobacteraceae bacterium]|nr:hypothetical protein [Caulobacteraceae bacterium]
MSWVKNFPRNAGQWELVATLAKHRNMLTDRFVAHLRQNGAAPEKIAGVWMVRADQWAEVEPLLDRALKPLERKPAPLAEEQQVLNLATGAHAELYKPVEEKLNDQAQLIEQLKRQVAELLAARGQL